VTIFSYMIYLNHVIPSISLSINISICHLSIYLSIYQYIYLSISPPIHLCIYSSIFLSNYADPHPANLLVRQHPSQAGKCQLVLLDHGLYRHLDKDFRMDYCRLWQGLVLSDEAIIKDSCERMNSGPLYPLLAAMITQKPWDAIMSDDLNR